MLEGGSGGGGIEKICECVACDFRIGTSPNFPQGRSRERQSEGRPVNVIRARARLQKDDVRLFHEELGIG